MSEDFKIIMCPKVYGNTPCDGQGQENGPQLDEAGFYAFTLYTCERCHNTFSVMEPERQGGLKHGR